MIDSERTTTIQSHKEIEAMPVATWGDWLDPRKRSQVEAFKRGSNPSRGVDVHVRFNPQPAESDKVLTTMVLLKDQVIDAVTPLYMALAHELIHAGRFQRGRAGYNRRAKTGPELKVGGYDAIDEESKGLTSREEIQTIGLPPIDREEPYHPQEKNYPEIETVRLDSNQITENALRDEHGLPLRAMYMMGEDVDL